MSKTKQKTNLSDDEFEAELRSEPKVFDGVALSVFTTEEGKFKVIKISLDKKTLEVGPVEVVETLDDRLEAISRFKILAVQNQIV